MPVLFVVSLFVFCVPYSLQSIKVCFVVPFLLAHSLHSCLFLLVSFPSFYLPMVGAASHALKSTRWAFWLWVPQNNTRVSLFKSVSSALVLYEMRNNTGIGLSSVRLVFICRFMLFLWSTTLHNSATDTTQDENSIFFCSGKLNWISISRVLSKCALH